MDTVNVYSFTTQSPFLVIIESTNDHIGNMHRIALGKRLVNMGLKHKSAKRINMNKIELIFDRLEEANKLIKGDSINLPTGWRAFIPNHKLYKIGIIKNVDVDIEDQYLSECICSSFPKSKIERLKRKASKEELQRGASEYIVTKTVKIFFNTERLPDEIFIETFYFRVEPFVQRVRQCTGCWRYGHSKNFCKTKSIVCLHCSRDHEFNQEESDCANLPAKCINCDMEHKANDRSCSKYISLNEINTAAAYQGISIQQARDTLRADSFNTYRRGKLGVSYSNVVTQNNKRKRTENEHEEYECSGSSPNASDLYNFLGKITKIFEAMTEQNNTIIKQNAEILNHFLLKKGDLQTTT